MRPIHKLLALPALVIACSAGTASGDTPVLVELFASHNCQVCPKAYDTLREIENERGDDVLILTWAVDYWDYLGEPDPLALPAAAARQTAYAERFGLRAPYTPQSVYDGEKECPATRKSTVEANIDSQKAGNTPYEIEIRAISTNRFTLTGAVPSPAQVQLVEYARDEARGGDMVNPVIEMRSLGLWSGGSVTYAYSCQSDCALIVQAPDFGHVYAAKALDEDAG
ncbi:DUF1223 domain-containing protein [Henriciella barbarensis]|uniref:DUF1223 domain-containing protein n=1 Tax=Henriciella barbarensis TaxID=86342 RepID=A0A399R446_9PROT|nr:DUF1223 domain-containing protein [Henriciella barbarensis]RIJ24482.1 DUF1223 domain-containing protein [Henriciella barbarensis]